MENEKKVFRSRMSVLLFGPIFFPFIYSAIKLVQHNEYQRLYVLGVALLICIFIFGGIRYVISGEKLSLKMWCIPNGSANIKDIISIKRSYNPLSAPSYSLKRLRIDFVKGLKYPCSSYWLISPVREKEFVDMLKAINPDIEVNIPEKKGFWRIWDWDI